MLYAMQTITCINVLNTYVISQCDKNISNRYDTGFKALSTMSSYKSIRKRTNIPKKKQAKAQKTPFPKRISTDGQ